MPASKRSLADSTTTWQYPHGVALSSCGCRYKIGHLIIISAKTRAIPRVRRTLAYWQGPKQSWTFYNGRVRASSLLFIFALLLGGGGGGGGSQERSLTLNERSNDGFKRLHGRGTISGATPKQVGVFLQGNDERLLLGRQCTGS
jgi:hypothetical protein